MGILNFNFVNFKEDDYWKSAQHLEINHNLDLAKKLPVARDITIDIDYQKYQKGIVWDDFKEMEPVLKERLKEISIYFQMGLKLQAIREKLLWKDFDERYKIQQLAIEAREIIANIPKSEHFPYLNFMIHKGRTSDIDHTINKEVDILLSYKTRASKRSKDAAVKEAVKYLESNIHTVEVVLKDFNPDPSYDWRKKEDNL